MQMGIFLTNKPSHGFFFFILSLIVSHSPITLAFNCTLYSILKNVKLLVFLTQYPQPLKTVENFSEQSTKMEHFPNS